MEDKGIVQRKSLRFAIRIANLQKYLVKQKHEYIMSKQILRSGTSIGANINEAEYAISDSDFIAKMFIAYKECAETLYWLEVLHGAEYLSSAQFYSINADGVEIQKILTAILNSAREKEKSKDGITGKKSGQPH